FLLIAPGISRPVCGSQLGSQPFSLLSVPNQPPHVQIVFPPDGVILGLQGPVEIRAQVSDTDGTIREVQFFAGTNLLGIVTNPPYRLTWQYDRPDGERTALSAVAVDDGGATGVSPLYVDGHQSGGQMAFLFEAPTN